MKSTPDQGHGGAVPDPMFNEKIRALTDIGISSADLAGALKSLLVACEGEDSHYATWVEAQMRDADSLSVAARNTVADLVAMEAAATGGVQ